MKKHNTSPKMVKQNYFYVKNLHRKKKKIKKKKKRERERSLTIKSYSSFKNGWTRTFLAIKIIENY